MMPSGEVVWLTGLPASGKTAVARELLALLEGEGRVALWLDSDQLRPFLTPGASYDDADRDRFYAALAEIARLSAVGGAFVVISATAPRRRYRDGLRGVVPRFTEVYLVCPAEVLRQRDPKGLYRKAAAQEITALPGAGGPYEAPEHPELTIDTSATAAAAAAEQILRRR